MIGIITFCISYNSEKITQDQNMAETEHGIYFVEEIAEGIYKFYEQRNASIYLVKGKEKACLIDTAYGLTDLYVPVLVRKPHEQYIRQLPQGLRHFVQRKRSL